MRRALILGPGGLQGAYGGGVVATLGYKLGCDFFDSVYACSAGAYTASYFLSSQPEMVEKIWRECVHSELLIRWKNLFKKGQPILELFYLNNVLRSKNFLLNTEALLHSRTSFELVATDFETGYPQYFSPRTKDEFFLQVRASAAVPFFHPFVVMGGRRYVDGVFSDPFPIQKAIADGHDEIIIVCNKSEINFSSTDFLILSLLAQGSRNRRHIVNTLWEMRRIKRLIESCRISIRVIAPSQDSVIRWNFDSAKIRINRLVDLGIQDALTFLG